VIALFFLGKVYPSREIGYLWLNPIGCAALRRLQPGVAGNLRSGPASVRSAPPPHERLLPVIAFGQQPCGFFSPRRYPAPPRSLAARKLHSEIGGENRPSFCHDSDHDPREKRARPLRHRKKPGEAFQLNFSFDNPGAAKVSRRLYLKRVRPDWQAKKPRSSCRPTWIVSLGRGFSAPLRLSTWRNSAWRCIAAWDCSKAFASCVRSDPALRHGRLRHPRSFSWMLRSRGRLFGPRFPRDGRIEAAQRRRFLRDSGNR